LLSPSSGKGQGEGLENKTLRRIRGTKRHKLTKECNKFHDEEHHNFKFSTKNIITIK